MIRRILNAKDFPMIPTHVPYMRNIVAKWFRPITIQRVVVTNENYLVKETIEEIVIDAAIFFRETQNLQPFPEGMRSWKIAELYTDLNTVLQNNDKVLYKGKRYKIVHVLDHDYAGFKGYRLFEDYIEREN